MNDRELLEMAAKAAGIAGEWTDCYDGDYYSEYNGMCGLIVDKPNANTVVWNPWIDDGDCARMEAVLNINVKWFDAMKCANAWVEDSCLHPDEATAYENYPDHAGNKQAARRMASLRVAAEIGKAMK